MMRDYKNGVKKGLEHELPIQLKLKLQEIATDLLQQLKSEMVTTIKHQIKEYFELPPIQLDLLFVLLDKSQEEFEHNGQIRGKAE